jgi:hypothetical protein
MKTHVEQHNAPPAKAGGPLRNLESAPVRPLQNIMRDCPKSLRPAQFAFMLVLSPNKEQAWNANIGRN